MSAVFFMPTPFTVVAGSQQALAPVSNANRDPVGLVWRSDGLSGVYAVLNVPGGVDTIALARSNLSANAQIRVQVAANSGMSNALVDRTVSAWSGLPSMDGAYTYIALEAVVNGPYVRIDITDPGNSAGYIQVQRVLLGRRVECDGVDHGASQTFEAGGVVDDGDGYTTVDRYRTRPSWKFTVSDTTALTYARDWYPLLMKAGKTESLLFIPETTDTNWQTQATLARITGSPKGESQSSDFWKMDINLLAV